MTTVKAIVVLLLAGSFAFVSGKAVGTPTPTPAGPGGEEGSVTQPWYNTFPTYFRPSQGNTGYNYQRQLPNLPGTGSKGEKDRLPAVGALPFPIAGESSASANLRPEGLPFAVPPPPASPDFPGLTTGPQTLQLPLPWPGKSNTATGRQLAPYFPEQYWGTPLLWNYMYSGNTGPGARPESGGYGWYPFYGISLGHGYSYFPLVQYPDPNPGVV